MNRDQARTMFHVAIDEIVDGLDVPKDEEIHLCQYEDADTVQAQLQELVDAVIFMSPKKTSEKTDMNADEFKKWLHDTVDGWLSDFDPADEQIVLFPQADVMLWDEIGRIYYLAPPHNDGYLRRRQAS